MPRFGKDGASMLLSPELHGVAKVSIAWVFMYLAATAFVSATKRTPAPGSPSRRPLDNQMVSGIHHMPCLSLTRHIRGAPCSPMCTLNMLLPAAVLEPSRPWQYA